MRLKPEDLRKIAKIFHDLTVNKYKLYAIKVGGLHEMDLTKIPIEGLDQLLERSLMAAINTVLTKHKPEPLPPTEDVKLLTYSGKGKKFNPHANDYLWAMTSKRTQ